jgi:PAS domain S-box-containing protein
MPPPIRILAVDDEAAIRESYREILQAARPADGPLEDLRTRLFGGTPGIARNCPPIALDLADGAEEAVARVQAALDEGRPYGVLFLDVRMPPGPDGIWAAGRIRSLAPELDIVIVTAFSDLDPQAISAQVRPSERLFYLQKPFHPHEIRQMAVALGGKSQAERLLAESESRLRLSMAAAQQGFYDLDVQTGEATVSEEYARMLGYDPAEFHETNAAWIARLHPQDREPVAEAYRDYIAGRTPEYRVEFRQRTKGGGWVWVLSLGKVLTRDAQGRPLRMLGTHTDITRSKQAETERAELEAQNRQLQKAESLGRMAGAIAHHFNNLLAVVSGRLELAMTALPAGPRLAHDLETAMQAVRRAAEVSGRMLTYLGKTDARRGPLDLSQVCRRSLVMLRAAMPASVALETDFPLPGATISANENQLQQVLTNLATNAWEALADGRGRIHLRATRAAPAEIPAVGRFPVGWEPRATGYAVLEVHDEGCGIAAPDMEKLFDPFFTRKFLGRGLGLPLVLGIVRAHGGGVTVASREGHGSCVRVYFPLAAAEASRPPAAPPPAVADRLPPVGSVLLVDDDEAVREMAAAMLALLGAEVLVARDGAEGLALFRRHRGEIGLVICDLTMPRMDGWQTLAALRLLVPGIAVIIASGYDEAQVLAGGGAEMPQALLRKPFTLDDLRGAIHKALA